MIPRINRLRALDRDKKTCQICGRTKKDGVLIQVAFVRHNPLNIGLDNLQTLCEDCNIGRGESDNIDYR